MAACTGTGTNFGDTAYAGKVQRLVAKETTFGVEPKDSRSATVDFIAAVTGVAATGSVVVLAGLPSAADTVTIGDGTNSVIFEFNTTLTVGDVLVNTSGFVDEEDYATGLKTALDASIIGSGGGGDLTSALSTTTALNDTVDLTNTIANGTTGNVAITQSGTGLTLTGMAGGVDAIANNQISTTDATLFVDLVAGQSFTVPAGTSTDAANIGTFTITAINNTVSPYTITVADTFVADTGVVLTDAQVAATRCLISYTGGDISETYESADNENVRPDRQAPHGILNNKSTDLANDGYLCLRDDIILEWLAAVHSTEWNAQVVKSGITLSVSVVGGVVTLTGGATGNFDDIEEGHVIELYDTGSGGFTQADDYGCKTMYKAPFTVISKDDTTTPSAPELVVANGLTIVDEGSVTATLVRGKYFRNGTDLPNSQAEVLTSYSVETRDPATKDGLVGDYRLYHGVVPSGVSMSVADGIVPCNFTLTHCSSRDRNPMTINDVPHTYTGTVVPAVTGNEIVNKTTFWRSEYALTAFQEFSYEVSDVVEAGREVSTSECSDAAYYPSYPIFKTIKPGGTIKVRHRSLDPLRKLESNSEFPISLRLEENNQASGVQSGNALVISMPSVRYANCEVTSGANDAVREETITYEARAYVGNDGYGYTVQFTLFDRTAY